jgi:hypothetical protein
MGAKASPIDHFCSDGPGDPMCDRSPAPGYSSQVSTKQLERIDATLVNLSRSKCYGMGGTTQGLKFESDDSVRVGLARGVGLGLVRFAPKVL